MLKRVDVTVCVCVTESLFCNLKLAQHCKSTLPEYKIKVKEKKMRHPGHRTWPTKRRIFPSPCKVPSNPPRHVYPFRPRQPQFRLVLSSQISFLCCRSSHKWNHTACCCLCGFFHSAQSFWGSSVVLVSSASLLMSSVPLCDCHSDCCLFSSWWSPGPFPGFG